MANLTSNAFLNALDGSLFAFNSTTGQIIPQTSSVKTAIEAAMRDAFGENLRLDAESPAGRLVEAWTSMATKFCAVTALYANQLNPRYATGQMLDAIGALFSVSRNARTSTTIRCRLGGTPSTSIPKGARISDNSGHVFRLSSTVTISSGGFADVVATSVASGAITVADNTVTTILDTVGGWATVRNTATLSIGTDVESDYNFRKRIINARWTGTAFLEDIQAEILRVDDIQSALVIENSEDSIRYLNESKQLVTEEPQTGKWVKLKGHSILAIVLGSASEEEIAEAIYATKSAGCAMCGLDSAEQGEEKGTRLDVPVTDPNSGVVYTITYNSPDTISFGVDITVAKGGYSGSDTQLETEIKSAIHGWAQGDYPYVDGIQLGQSIYSYEIGAAVSDAISPIQIKSVKVFLTDSPSTKLDNISLFVNEYGSLSDDNINVTIE